MDEKNMRLILAAIDESQDKVRAAIARNFAEKVEYIDPDDIVDQLVMDAISCYMCLTDKYSLKDAMDDHGGEKQRKMFLEIIDEVKNRVATCEVGHVQDIEDCNLSHWAKKDLH